MSMLVARMEKRNTQNLGGMQKHNQREFKNHSNKEIDISRSHLNYDLVNAANINYREKIMSIIESQKQGSRAIRKDAVLVNEWIITSDQNFFKDLSAEKRNEFFKKATQWFQERYGKQNMAFAQVHLDETTPHMHLGVVPMRDGKLQAKNVFNRKELLAIQEELPKFLQSEGFEIDRGGEGSKAKHLTVPEYKKMVKDIERIKQEKKDIALEASETAQISMEKKKGIEILEKEKDVLESEYGRLSVILIDVKRQIEKEKALLEKIKQQQAEVQKRALETQKVFNDRLHLNDDLKAIERRTEPVKRLFGGKDKEEEVKLSKKDFERLLELADRGVGAELIVSAEKEKNAKLLKKNNEMANKFNGLAKNYEILLGNKNRLIDENNYLKEEWQKSKSDLRKSEQKISRLSNFVLSEGMESKFQEWNKKMDMQQKREQNRRNFGMER